MVFITVARRKELYICFFLVDNKDKGDEKYD